MRMRIQFGRKNAAPAEPVEPVIDDPVETPDQVETPETETTLDADVLATLLFTIEEEKLAGDVYETLYDLTGLRVFYNIAQSEDRHFDAVVARAEALGVDVSAYLETEDGEFIDPELQDLYDQLVFDGSQSVEDAIEVGLFIEATDIIDLQEAVEEAEAAGEDALAAVYESLLAGSCNHLDAFENQLV